MSLQDVVDALIAAERGKTLAASPQWTLGQIIMACDNFGPDRDNDQVVFDFCGAAPSGIDSWRGSYAELAISFEIDGHMPFGKFRSILKDANGSTFEGYKGGDFRVDMGTPVWVANWGCSGNTGVVGLHDDGYQIVINTAWCEF